MEFTFDSSDIGAGPFETRVYCELDEGELYMRLDDGTPVEFNALTPRDQGQVADWIRHFKREQEVCA